RHGGGGAQGRSAGRRARRGDHRRRSGQPCGARRAAERRCDRAREPAAGLERVGSESGAAGHPLGSDRLHARAPARRRAVRDSAQAVTRRMSALGELIAERSREGGPISFAEYMDISLYHPELGYYARAARRTGRAGDFFTSVDVGPIFGELLAKQFAEMWRLLPESSIPGPPGAAFDLVEAGAGNGRLARDVLDAAERSDPDFYAAIRLSLVEKSGSARAAQLETLGRHGHLLVHSEATLPSQVRGLIFANELLDALPTHAVAMTASGLREVFIDHRDGRFVECVRDLSSPRLAEYLARAGATLGKGWRAEVNLAAEEWIGNAARALS